MDKLKRFWIFVPLFLFGTAGAYLFFVFLKAGNEGAFQNSLLPELIGFCLEGFFLVGLFSLIQRRQIRERKQELRQSLRGALREILSHIDLAVLEENMEPASTQSLDQDTSLIRTLFVKVHGGQLDLNSMLSIKKAAERNVGTMHDLIPVAAQLSANHMRWWLAIVECVRKLSEATDKSSISFTVQQFLKNLGEFDQLPL